MKLNELLDNHGKKCILASAFNVIIGSFIIIILDYCELGFFTEAICETFIWMFMGIGICLTIIGVVFLYMAFSIEWDEKQKENDLSPKEKS